MTCLFRAAAERRRRLTGTADRGQFDARARRLPGRRPTSIMSKNIFEKIIAREIPADIVYEDEMVLAFRDINPKAPTHVLIVPKKSLARLSEAGAEDEKLLGRLLLKAGEVARQLGLNKSGYRVVINNGRDGGETVPHLHCHILGGRGLAWPPG